MPSPRLVSILKDARPYIDTMLKQATKAFELKNEDRGRWCIAQVEQLAIGIANCIENGLAWEIFKSSQPDYERSWSSIKTRIQTEPNKMVQRLLAEAHGQELRGKR